MSLARRRRRPLAPVAAVPVTIVLAAALTACSGSGSGSCEYGAGSVDAALTGFLTAVAEGDTEGAAQLLVPGNTVDPAAFEELQADLDGVSLDDMTLDDDQMGSHHAVAVTSAQGGQIGTFEVSENSGCAAVAWGDFPEQPAPDPGESQTASAG